MDDGHVAKYTGVAGMVYLHTIFKFDDIAAGLSAIDHRASIFNAAGVKSIDHGGLDVPNLLAAAFIHGRNLLGPLFLQPPAKLIDAHHGGSVLLGQGCRIPDMIAMPMG